MSCSFQSDAGLPFVYRFSVCVGVGVNSQNIWAVPPGGVFPNRQREGTLATPYPDDENSPKPSVQIAISEGGVELITS